MPKLTPRAGTLGLVLTAYDVWRKLPKDRRNQIVAQVRKHGPTVARTAAQRLKKR